METHIIIAVIMTSKNGLRPEKPTYFWTVAY